MFRPFASAAALAVAVLVGCADDGGPGDGTLDPGRGPEGYPVPWVRAEPSAGGRVLRLGYESDPCTQARAAVVDETDDRITVTLLDPDRDPQQACIAIVKTGCAAVELEEPVAGRRVVNGAPERYDISELKRLPFTRYGRCRPVRRY